MRSVATKLRPRRSAPCWALVIVTALWACAGGERGGRRTDVAARRDTETVVRYCLEGSAAPVRISEDSIGSLDLGMDLRSLRRICAAAHDTIRYGENDAYPAVVFPFNGLTAVAVQYRDALRLDEPADAWVVRGGNGVLPGEVSLTASWAQFRKAYGRGLGHAAYDVGVTVMFCAHPRLFVHLDVPGDSVPPGLTADLSRIPNDARITELSIFLKANPTWTC